MSSLPLHSVIKNLIDGAKEKVAAEQDSPKVRNLIKFEKKEHGHIPSVEEEKAEYGEKTATASFTDPTFVEKLAQATDFLAQNIDQIEQPGPLAQAVSRVTNPAPGATPEALQAQGEEEEAEEGAPAVKVAEKGGVGAGLGAGALPVSKAIGGTQKYKKDKPKTEDAAASQANTPLSNAGRGGSGSKTQMDNNLHKAPGQGSGSVPRAMYPAKGPLVNQGKGKTASAVMPSQQAKNLILEKLAGEDVMPANISASKSANPLAGKGQLSSYDANTAPPKASGGPTEGFGNQGRKHIRSIGAAIDMTKKDAKGPVKSQLKEVLEEPALTRKTDSKVHENLRNADKGGVKIAQVRSRLSKVAAAGCVCGGKGECTFDLLKEAASRARGGVKTANAMMGYGGGGAMGGMGDGGGMAAMAGGVVDPASPEGMMENDRVARLKLLLAKARMANPGAAAGAPPPGAGMPPAAAGGAPAAGAGIVPGPVGA